MKRVLLAVVFAAVFSSSAWGQGWKYEYMDHETLGLGHILKIDKRNIRGCNNFSSTLNFGISCSKGGYKGNSDWKLAPFTILILGCNALSPQYRRLLKRKYGMYSLPERFRKTKYLVDMKVDNGNLIVDEVDGSIIHTDLSGGRWEQMIMVNINPQKLLGQMKDGSNLQIGVGHEELNLEIPVNFYIHGFKEKFKPLAKTCGINLSEY